MLLLPLLLLPLLLLPLLRRASAARPAQRAASRSSHRPPYPWTHASRLMRTRHSSSLVALAHSRRRVSLPLPHAAPPLAQAGAVYSAGVYVGGALASLSILVDDSVGPPAPRSSRIPTAAIFLIPASAAQPGRAPLVVPPIAPPVVSNCPPAPPFPDNYPSIRPSYAPICFSPPYYLPPKHPPAVQHNKL